MARRARRRGEQQDGDPPPWFRLSPAGTRKGPIAIVGAGLAGCWLAHELAARGRHVTLIDRHDAAGRGASGNPVGVVKPFVTRERSVAERFHGAAFDHLLDRLARCDLAARSRFSPIGVVQLVERAFERRPDLQSLDRDDSSRRAGIALASATLAFERGGWLDPSALCNALLEPRSQEPVGGTCEGGRDGCDDSVHEQGHIDTRFGAALETPVAHEGRWHLAFDDGRVLQTDTVVLAGGPAIVATPWTAHLPMTPARGQLDRFERGDIGPARSVVTGSSWLIPEGGSVWAGATYTRHSFDDALCSDDSEFNREALAALTSAVPGAWLAGRAGVRATLPDRLPLVGPVVTRDSVVQRYADLQRGKPATHYDPPPTVAGLAVLGGFGSRGIVTSALSAALLADWLCGDASGLQAWYALLAPHRFLIRDARRGRL